MGRRARAHQSLLRSLTRLKMFTERVNPRKLHPTKLAPLIRQSDVRPNDMRHQRRRRNFLHEPARRPLTRNERVGYPQTKVVGFTKVGA